MLIAVSAEGRELTSNISQRFESCRFLLLIETDSMEVKALENENGSASLVLANEIVDRDCEAVITGSFTPEIFNIIADACITRYNGGGFTVDQALDRMDNNTLDYIRYADGEDTCHGDHGGGECNCGEDD